MKYTAKITVGQFNVGDEVTGLTAERVKELLEAGAIVEAETKTAAKIEPKAETKTTAKTTTAKAE